MWVSIRCIRLMYFYHTGHTGWPSNVTECNRRAHICKLSNTTWIVQWRTVAVSRAAIVAQVKQLRLPGTLSSSHQFHQTSYKCHQKQPAERGHEDPVATAGCCVLLGLVSTAHTQDEYVTMVVTLCENFPQLKDKKPFNGAYWLSRSSVHIHACFSHTI